MITTPVTFSFLPAKKRQKNETATGKKENKHI